MWSARAEVHQATGMVIAQLRMPADDALAILRAHAYANDTTLADIAHQVVTRQLDFQGES
jgi:AmiR/NasT family two-component response regulator